MDKSILAAAFGWAGTCTSCFFFISPLNLFLELNKTKSTEKIPGLMLIVNVISTSFLVIYGLSGAGAQLWVCNGIGLIFSFTYLTWYFLYYFEDSTKKILSIITTIIIVAGLLVLAILSYINIDTYGGKVRKPIGMICMVLNILMYAAPGQNLYYVLKYGKYELIPILSSLVGLLNAIFWTIFSCTKFDAIDFNVFIPNIIGIALFIFQIFVWLYFYQKRKNEKNKGRVYDENENEKSTEFIQKYDEN